LSSSTSIYIALFWFFVTLLFFAEFVGGGFLLSIMLEDLGSFAGLLAFDIKLCDP